jgi:hypothetical protein
LWDGDERSDEPKEPHKNKQQLFNLFFFFLFFFFFFFFCSTGTVLVSISIS